MIKSNRVTVFIAPSGDYDSERADSPCGGYRFRAWFMGPKKKKDKKIKEPDRYRSWEEEWGRVAVLRMIKRVARMQNLRIHKVVHLSNEATASKELQKMGRL